MNFSENDTLLDFLYHWEKTTPATIYLKQPFGNTWKDFTWAETATQVRKIAQYLRNLNLPEKSNIALVSKNCAEWIISDLAIMLSGHVSVPLYPTLIGPQINQVMVHAGCKVAFIGKLDDWAAMKPGIPEEVLCVSFPTYNPDPNHVQWNEILEREKPFLENLKPKMTDVNTIIYTSGTTGNPKGVITTYGAFTACVMHTSHLTFLNRPNNRFFSYLPLCHIAERNIVEAVSIISGGVVFFAESLESFAKNLNEAKPTHFLAVPRIWTKFQQGILDKMPQNKLDFLLKIPIFNKVVKKKIREGLGLNQSIICLTGAAPMPLYLIKWFRKIDIHIQEAYGMTENLGAVCMMPPDKIKDGTVGKIYPKMEIKIDVETGEILNKSPWNMIGYYNEPALTAQTIDTEGWLHTGDVGEVDEDGYLKITGRVKEMYKTSKGEYIAPTQIEVGFAENTNIDQICLVGQNLPQPIALVVLSEAGKKLSETEIIESLTITLDELNPKLRTYEKVQKIVLMKEVWNVENNKLTPTLKIKRNSIEKDYGECFEKWYEREGKVIFE
jgi:long-chain acyl-CoA synthetase